MSKKKRMQYKGESKDIAYNPWLRLVHGRHYHVEKTKMSSGKIRVRVFDELDTGRVFYDDESEFKKEWC